MPKSSEEINSSSSGSVASVSLDAGGKQRGKQKIETRRQTEEGNRGGKRRRDAVEGKKENEEGNKEGNRGVKQGGK